MKNMENFMRSIKRNSRRLFYILPVIALFGMATLFLWQATAKMQDAKVQDSNRTTKEEALAILQSDYFDEMSSAGQMNIERMAGARKIDGVIKPIEYSSFSILNDEYVFAPLNGGEIPFTSSFVDPLVNNPAADTTAQNTQSETTIVLGSGNNVVSAFNDSGSFLGGLSHFTGFSTSANSGTAWTDRGALPTAPGSGDAGDPSLARSITLPRSSIQIHRPS